MKQFSSSNPVDISFVIPAYNEELVIAQCISSILREVDAHPEVRCEIVVVNNNSTDRTVEVSRSFPRVRIITEQQQGLVWARKAGLEASTGRLVANLDADTIMPRGWLQRLLDEFAAHPDLVCLTGPHSHYDLPLLQRGFVRLFYFITYAAYAVNRFVLKGGSMVQGGNFVVTRKAIETIGYDPETYSFYGEDVDLAKRLPAVGDVKFKIRFFIYASGRRFYKEGLARTGIRYILNYLHVMLLKRPLTKQHKDIRIQSEHRIDVD